MAICVNITRKELYSDTTVTLIPGDHPFIKKESVAHYPDAQPLDLNKVQGALDASPTSYICRLHDSCSPELLSKLQIGLLNSPHATNGLKIQMQKYLDS